MAYQCLDCTYKAKKNFAGGKCPACDSFNIKGTQVKRREVSKKRKTLGDIIFMVLLWSLIAYGFWEQYLKPSL